MHDGPPGLPRPPGATRYGDRRRPSPERSEMSEDEDRINRIAAEQMLSTTWVGWGVGSDPLAELLAAQAAAASDSSPGGDLTSTGGSPSAWPSTSAQLSAPPPANVRDLCVAIDTTPAPDRASALDDPAFTVLITAAGGKDQVAAYCAAVLASEPASSSAHPGDPSYQPSSTPPSSSPTSPSSTPSPTSPPPGTPSPTSAPRTHPSGPPSTHPSGPARSRPSGGT